MPVITPAQHSLIVFKAILVVNSIKLLKQQPLINMVFDDEQFIDTASPHFEFRQPTQICISRNTVRKAINQLIADNKIRLSNGSYEYVPHLESALKEHPILPVAQQVAITIGVPESILVLTITTLV